MKVRHCLLPAACLLLAALLATPVAAYDQPSVNLGFTSFLDGGPPAGPGFYFAEYIQYYTADKLADLGVPNPDLDVWVSLNQFIYQSDQKVLFGGKWGLDVIVPIVALDASPNPPLSSNDGLGDILVGPYLQWDPIMGDNGPKFMHRVELQMLLPTGKNDATVALNPGSNFFSFNPYWAGTYFFSPKLTASWRLHYLWNAENDDTQHQAGQAIHANFAAGYELMPNKLRAGVNGYYLKQVSSSEDNGVTTAGDPKEQVLGIGPGALYSFSKDTHLFFNMYFETSAENRSEGERFNVRLVHHF
ncbi:MAG: transporter [Sedimentisphaerales bacterium]|nr:transporter [Sedimentisphaerales bacterium]